jgi:hypothetical protein
MCCYTCDFIREICAIRGQKYNRIFTTDSADNADESQRLQQRIVCAQKSVFSRFCSILDGQTALGTWRCPAKVMGRNLFNLSLRRSPILHFNSAVSKAQCKFICLPSCQRSSSGCHHANADRSISRLFGIATLGSSFPSNSRETYPPYLCFRSKAAIRG